jgi:hypothetical protein
MGRFDKFKIDLRGLKQSAFKVEYDLDNKFFEDIDGQEFQKGTIEIRLQKDEKSPRYRIWGSSLGGAAGIHLRTKIQQGNDYSDSWDLRWAGAKQHKVMMKRISKPGESPVTEIRIPLALFGGPAVKGEKRMIDFVFHVKKYCYTWEYNINLLNWRHRYTSIGTLEF